MKSTLVLVLATILVSCSEQKTDTPVTPGQTNDSLTTQATTNDTSITPDDYPTAIEIGRKKLHPGRIELNAPFVGDSALKVIFPGKYTETEGNDEIYHVVWWKCDACERIPLHYNYFIEPESLGNFPDSGFNTSLVLGQQKLVLNNEDYELLFFFHTENFAPEFNGRFMGAPTGAALFKKKNNRYIMENFSAVLGCYGSFSTPILPDVFRVNQNMVLIDFTYSNGGAGSEYTAVKEIFLPENGGFKKVFFDRFLYCSNTCMGEWSSEMEATDSLTTNGLSDLVIKTEGYADGGCMEDYQLHYFDTSTDELKAKVKLAMEKKEKFNFIVTRTFHYNGKEYVRTDSKTDFK